MHKKNISEKIKKVLVGVAYGDAMGMPTECWSRDKILKIYPEGLKTLVPSNPGDMFGREMKAGEITDDTINTLLIADMLIKNDGVINVENYIDQLVKWTEDSEVSSYVSGPSTLRALDKIKKGIPIEETGTMGTTNGAAMKIAPIGIVTKYQEIDKLIENVYNICLPTHNTNIAMSGATIVAALINKYMYDENINSFNEEIYWGYIFEIIDNTKDLGYDFPAASLKKRVEIAKEIIENEDEKNVLNTLYEVVGASVETIESIPAALAIVALAKGDVTKAGIFSANIGWDTDTIGAISCSICGAMGSSVEEATIKILEEVNNIDFEYIANKLAEVTDN